MTRRPRRVAAAVLSGLLLAAAFPPLDLGPLALVALVPLLWAWRGAGPLAAALYGGAAGIAFFAVLVEWSRYFGVVAVVPLVLFLSTWWVLAGAVVGWLGRKAAAAAPVVAAVWVLVEAARGRVPFGGFPWGDVGYAFHDWGAARAVAGWGGVTLVSWIAVTVNGLVLEAGLAWRRRRRVGAAPVSGLAILRPVGGLIILLAIAGVAARSLPDLRPTGRLRVAMVQANDLNRDPTPQEVRDRYIVRNHLRLAGEIKDEVDLIMLPESSLDADPRQDRYLDLALSALAADHDADVLAGGNTPAPHGRLYNTVFHYVPEPADPEEPTGTGRTGERYSKRHLVPFGEYVPWRAALSFIEELQQVPTDYEPGPGPTVFAVGDHRLGALICFESAFPALGRQYARRGADALVVLTNNRSYRRSANSAQHLAMGQFRAAETGRPLLQAAISGITAVVDHTGEVRSKTRLFEPTVLVGDVQTYQGRTPYTMAGEWVLAASALLLAGAVLADRRRRPPNRSLMGDGEDPRMMEGNGQGQPKGNPPVDWMIDVFVHTPIGLAVMAWKRVPDFVSSVPDLVGQAMAKGCAQLADAEERISEEMRKARMIGEVAVTFGGRQLRREVDARLRDAREAAGGVASFLPGMGGASNGEGAAGAPNVTATATPTAPASPVDAGADSAAAKPAATKPSDARPATKPAGARKATKAPGATKRSRRPAAAAAADLPIPEYDGLSASQVVSRLTGLSPDELRAIRSYEESGRGRRTVLVAIDRLL
jgi:apolipoprotein N-acyltransferase